MPRLAPWKSRKVRLGVLALILLALGLWVAAPWYLPAAALEWLSWHGYDMPFGTGQARHQPPSKLPGPPRDQPLAFTLTAADATAMVGHGEVPDQRWRDVGDNDYSEAFREAFSYSHVGDDGPQVLLRFDATGPTLRGRLEAHRLKPNFAYQIKLLGDWADPRSAEAIGYAGRWRLPGGGTNFSDDEYRQWPQREEVEAYLFFDYFVTDGDGNAVRNLALDSSLHVLWQHERQWPTPILSDLLTVTVDAGNPAIYAMTSTGPTQESLWAERESQRYQSADQVIGLPPGDYRAKLVLTEESFHSYDEAGGYWATVMSADIHFVITTE